MQLKHRLSDRSALTVADLAEIPLLLLKHDFQTRELFDEACQSGAL
jgi:hypothetical protein